MKTINLKLRKDRITKNMIRFAGEIDGKVVNIYLPKERIPTDLEDVSVTIK